MTVVGYIQFETRLGVFYNALNRNAYYKCFRYMAVRLNHMLIPYQPSLLQQKNGSWIYMNSFYKLFNFISHCLNSIQHDSSYCKLSNAPPHSHMHLHIKAQSPLHNCYGCVFLRVFRMNY